MSNPCRLIKYTPFPPGGFPFSEAHNGFVYNFPDVGMDMNEQSKVIAKFRKSNGFERATYVEAFDDLNIYTCQRIGCDPNYCSDGTTTAANPMQVISKGCGSCGAKL